jgi:quercetin dioxygenase-like cupin family protein
MASLQMCLNAGELLRPRLSSNIRVLKGQLWLTRKGDRDDHFMAPGDVACIKPEEFPLIEAIKGKAMLSVEVSDTTKMI